MPKQVQIQMQQFVSPLKNFPGILVKPKSPKKGSRCMILVEPIQLQWSMVLLTFAGCPGALRSFSPSVELFRPNGPFSQPLWVPLTHKRWSIYLIMLYNTPVKCFRVTWILPEQNLTPFSILSSGYVSSGQNLSFAEIHKTPQNRLDPQKQPQTPQKMLEWLCRTLSGGFNPLF